MNPSPDPARRRVSDRYGPWAVVTGASSGIGRAFAAELAACGLNVVLIARGEASLMSLAADLMAQSGVETRVIAVDLSEPGAAEAASASTEDLDVGLLVASAGFGVSGDVTQTDASEERAMIEVNCAALFAMARRAAIRMRARGRGGIVLLSSIVAFQGVAGSANYAATKAYVQTLAEGMHRELRPHGVDVLAVAPGPVETGFAARAGLRMTGAARPEQVARAALPALGRRMTVRPGLRNQVMQAALASLPRPLRARVLQQVMAGMTAATRAGGDRP